MMVSVVNCSEDSKQGAGGYLCVTNKNIKSFTMRTTESSDERERDSLCLRETDKERERELYT